MNGFQNKSNKGKCNVGCLHLSVFKAFDRSALLSAKCLIPCYVYRSLFVLLPILTIYVEGNDKIFEIDTLVRVKL